MNQRYLVIIERAHHNFAAYSPDLPGCVATGKTREETLANMREAIPLHIEGLQESGRPVPAPATTAEYLAV